MLTAESVSLFVLLIHPCLVLLLQRLVSTAAITPQQVSMVMLKPIGHVSKDVQALPHPPTATTQQAYA